MNNSSSSPCSSNGCCLSRNFLSDPDLEMFNDVNVIDKDGDVHPANKTILASQSKLLRKMFTEEPGKSKFEMEVLSGTAFEDLLNFIKTGHLNLSWINIWKTLETAEYLGLSHASKTCQDWLIERLNHSTSLHIWRFAKSNLLIKLEASSFASVLEVMDLVHPEEFCTLPVSDLIEILSSDYLAVSEDAVDHILSTWSASQKRSPDELDAVRICYRAEGIDKPRNPREVLITFGGWESQGDVLVTSNGSPSRTVGLYNPSAKKWSKIGELPVKLAYAEAIKIGSEVYIAGGHIPDIVEGEIASWASRKIFKFKPELTTVEFVEMSSMNVGRNYPALAACDGQIYVIGGNTGHRRLSSVERYDPRLNQWFPEQSMSRRRSDAAAAVVDSKIYVCGGFDGVEPTNSVEVFDTYGGTWANLSPMSRRRSGVKAISYHDMIYVVGGWDGTERLASGEVYDPCTKKWSSLPEMKTPRSNHTVTVLGSKLYVAGGYDGHDTTDSVEFLDLGTPKAEWEDGEEKVTEMVLAKSALASVALPYRLVEEILMNCPETTDSEFSDISMDSS